ncbi:MAG: anti-sigma factor [Ilumatobacteraceae bacterium]
MAEDPIEDLIGAYVLDALDDHERRQVEAYLEANPRARAEVQELREVTSMLAFSNERPPEGLWDRIAGELDGTAPEPGPELSLVMPRPRRRWVGAALGIGSALVAAAAAVVITVAVVGDDATEPGGDDVLAMAYGEASSDPASRRAELQSDDRTMAADAVLLDSGVGYLSAGTLPELPTGETYQLWGVYGDEDVISLGVIGNRPAIEPFTAVDDVRALIITREEVGGVISSTNPTLLVGQLG